MKPSFDLYDVIEAAGGSWCLEGYVEGIDICDFMLAVIRSQREMLRSYQGPKVEAFLKLKTKQLRKRSTLARGIR